MPTWSLTPLLRPDSWQIGIIPAPACPPGRLSFGVKSRPDELVPSILTDVVKCRLEEFGYGHVDMSFSRRVSKQPEHESVAFAPSLSLRSLCGMMRHV